MAIASAGLGTGTLILAPLAQVLVDSVGWRGGYGLIGGTILLLALPVGDRHGDVADAPARVERLAPVVERVRLARGEARLERLESDLAPLAMSLPANSVPSGPTTVRSRSFTTGSAEPNAPGASCHDSTTRTGRDVSSTRKRTIRVSS